MFVWLLVEYLANKINNKKGENYRKGTLKWFHEHFRVESLV